MVPKLVFLTKGIGKHKDRLHSFEMALREAHIEKYNLVKVSSILPPGCKIIPKEEGISLLRPGEIVYCVLSECYTNEPRQLVVASIGMAIPRDDTQYGYFAEHHVLGETEDMAGKYAESLAISMLASTMGEKFDPNLDWEERESAYRLQGKLVRTLHITQSGQGDEDGVWTTVIAAAVFVPDT